MRAIEFRTFDGPQALEVIEVETPWPGPGEVLVRVEAAGLNFFETLMLRDAYAATPALPMRPGVEVAGTVEALGAGVEGVAPGARVGVPLFVSGGGGGYAEFVTARAEELVPLPDAVSFEAATALMVQGLTALYAARHVALKGKTVYVPAAAGGVGSLLVQLARIEGAAKVIAGAGSADKVATALALGADAGIDYSAPGWLEELKAATGGAGVDVIHDFAGGEGTAALTWALAPGGTLVFGAMGRFALSRDVTDAMMAANQALKGFYLLPLVVPERARADIADLLAMAADGRLSLLPVNRFALARAGEAHAALEERRTTGKVVLVP
jgi:NADPH:quinone reductase and related Zn-dependent oxidoreductases